MQEINFRILMAHGYQLGRLGDDRIGPELGQRGRVGRRVQAALRGRCRVQSHAGRKEIGRSGGHLNPHGRLTPEPSSIPRCTVDGVRSKCIPTLWNRPWG